MVKCADLLTNDLALFRKSPYAYDDPYINNGYNFANTLELRQKSKIIWGFHFLARSYLSSVLIYFIKAQAMSYFSHFPDFDNHPNEAAEPETGGKG